MSQNGTLSDGKAERTRVQDRPNISVAELAALQRGYVERLGKLIEQLAAVMTRPDSPTAAIESPAVARDVVADRGRSAASNGGLAKLVRTPLAGGDASYAFRSDLLRSVVGKLLGAPRPAFVERGAATNAPFLELMDTTDRAIAAAMAHAIERYGNDDVMINVGGRYTGKLIAHAVASGITVANTDPYIQYLVARERERQANPLTRRVPGSASRRPIAVIERVAAAPQRPR